MAALPSFRRELKRLTQQSYLLGSSVAMLMESSPSSVAQNLKKRIESLCTDGREITAAALTTSQVHTRRQKLAPIAADVLLVFLDAVLHVHLAEESRIPRDVQPPSVEDLIAQLGGAGASVAEWWYRDVVLLSEIRNRIVHADGRVLTPCARLAAAGWVDADLAAEPEAQGLLRLPAIQASRQNSREHAP
jgi:hypothetical protein